MFIVKPFLRRTKHRTLNIQF